MISLIEILSLSNFLIAYFVNVSFQYATKTEADPPESILEIFLRSW